MNTFYMRFVFPFVAVAIQIAVASVVNEKNKAKLRDQLLAVWQSAKLIPAAYPGDPAFQ